jgi:hypothetical protein
MVRASIELTKVGPEYPLDGIVTERLSMLTRGV